VDLRIATIRLVAMRWINKESCAYLLPAIRCVPSSNSDRADGKWAGVRDPEILAPLNRQQRDGRMSYRPQEH